jgi:serine/threonine-protein kinase RsbW
VSNLQPEIIRLDIPASFAYLQLLSDCISLLLSNAKNRDNHEELVYNVQLAAHEVCTNIVSHAYAGFPGRISITLELSFHPAQLTLKFLDTGQPFNLKDIPEVDLDEPHIHGYGLFLIHNLMDHVTYTPLPEKNQWCLVKHL